MSAPGHRMECRCRACMEETSAALLALRDSLNELSLALKDLLFEADVARRAEAERSVDVLLKGFSAHPPVAPERRRAP